MLNIKSIVLAAVLSATALAAPRPQCKCFPGDLCWPSEDDWTDFNATVGGRLVASVPLGSVCHQDSYSTYDAASCEALKANWPFPETHYSSPSSPMTAWFANDSCNPFTDPDAFCDGRSFVQYAVKATGVEDYKRTLAFAAEKNIRLVIRNTGHDYFGKSSGAGSLALWTHFLKNTEVIESYSSDAYSGSALKVGAGVQAFEAYAAADAAGLAVAGGDCDTVGIAGGYTQGGGLGPLSSFVGLAADQVLEWEVVTAGGDHIHATPTNCHKSLYWALSGGGGGTFAAVVSVTVAAHPTMKVAGATLTFSDQAVGPSAFANVVKTFMKSLPKLTAARTWSSFYIVGGVFQLVPAFGPGLTGPELQALLDPTLASLNESGIAYQYQIKTFETFKSGYDAMVPENNVTLASSGGRLIPHSLLETEHGVSSLYDVFQAITDSGGIVSGIVSDQSQFPLGHVQNAVNPAFRKSIMNVVFGLPYNQTDYEANVPAQKFVTNNIMPRLEALSPKGGSYLNEADFNQPNWQNAFYGKNYAKLSSVKERYDPDGLFYGLTAVGSEKWISRLNTDGRLCRV